MERNADNSMMGSLRTDAWAMVSQQAAINNNGPILRGLQGDPLLPSAGDSAQAGLQDLTVPSVIRALTSHHTHVLSTCRQHACCGCGGAMGKRKPGRHCLPFEKTYRRWPRSTCRTLSAFRLLADPATLSDRVQA